MFVTKRDCKMIGSGPGNIRKKQVLFIHCGGTQGLHEGSNDLVAWLRLTLGPAYEVLYPTMPDPDNPQYSLWKEKLDEEFARLTDGTILIGHSIGGSVLLKYLSEEKCDKIIAGLFVIASPFWGKRNWKVDEYVLQHEFAKKLPEIGGIYFYHGKKDAVVPFKHLSFYAEKLPHATVRAFDSREHLFSAGLPVLAGDIINLNAVNN